MLIFTYLQTYFWWLSNKLEFDKLICNLYTIKVLLLKKKEISEKV